MARARKTRRRGCKRCIIELNKDGFFLGMVDRIGGLETEEGLAIWRAREQGVKRRKWNLKGGLKFLECTNREAGEFLKRKERLRRFGSFLGLEVFFFFFRDRLI